ncbi:hypothetical protein FJ251_08165 [bacterium]|nr:hypothetical protein [bacterium]
MSRRTSLLCLSGGIAAMILVAGLTLGWLLSAGTLSLEFASAGEPPLRIAVPGALVQAGLYCLPQVAVARAAQASGCQGDTDWRPLVGALCAALAECPAGEFVRVESADERVIVSKNRRHLLVRVESPEESLRLQIPLRSLRSFGRQLAAR